MLRAMRHRVPSFFLLVPGPWSEARVVVAGLEARGLSASAAPGPIRPGMIRVEVITDDGLAESFGWNHAALVEIAGRLDERAAVAAAIGRALRDLGGVAIRMEASGAVSAWEPWLERMESGSTSRLHDASVIVVVGERTAFTCGMHQFDLPDAEIDVADAADASRWLTALNLYQLVEQPALASGHTFHPDTSCPRRVLERWPDHRHADADGRHNPFGVWRLVADDADALEALDPIPTIVPSLVATLLAAERDKGAALTEEEVDRVVDGAPAIAMSAEDLRALERSRGYADIEPRRAWAQWQIFRSSAM